MKEKPNPMIVDRAVELWKRMLTELKYDAMGNDPDPAMGVASAMAHMLPSNADHDRLDKFGKHLREFLMTPDRNGCYRVSLNTDYCPDYMLCQSAEKAGLKVEFPWKVNMYLDANNVSVSCGYRAPYVYHYPLPGGRWLVTKLSGPDISKVIEYVEGRRPVFEIE